MNKYYIMDEEYVLCDGKGIYTDKYGNKRKRLIYWSNQEDIKGERIKANIFRAKFILFTIWLFAHDIKAKLKQINEKCNNKLDIQD